MDANRWNTKTKMCYYSKVSAY